MLIGKTSGYYLKKVRAKAKMYEYEIPEDEHIYTEKQVNDLIFLVLGILGDVCDDILKSKDKPILVDKDKKNELSFISNFFDAYFQSKIKEDMNDYFVLLGAASYYFSDMLGSTKVMLDLLNDKILDISYSGLENTIVDLLNDKKEIDSDKVSKEYKRFITMLNSSRKNYIENNIECDFESMFEFREYVYKYGSDRELLFTDILLAIYKKKIINSSLSLLSTYSHIDVDVWAKTFKNNQILELWPSQIMLGEFGVFDGKSAVIQMPTGERVIIVTRCINAFKLRVSETLTKYISSLLRVIKV
ncbi:MAG: hypothetical protein GXZ08_05790 [Tissierellia bacterium]|nr:hypothetical protein [Tissierellia bacterium]